MWIAPARDAKPLPTELRTSQASDDGFDNPASLYIAAGGLVGSIALGVAIHRRVARELSGRESERLSGASGREKERPSGGGCGEGAADASKPTALL